MVPLTTSVNRVPREHASVASAVTPASTVRRASAATSLFRALFTKAASATRPAATPAMGTVSSPDPTAAPTAESVFGANPWASQPMGFNPDGSQFSYNPIYFASASTAQKVAQMLGGTVIARNDIAPNAQQQPNLLVQMADGRTINAGLVASFYTHGYPQSYIDGLIAGEINGTAA